MSTEAVVVGAGIVGAAIADALSAEGIGVLVIDAGFPGCGTTAAGMGHIVVMDDSPAQLALTALSRRLVARIAEDMPASCELDRCGTLWIAEDERELEIAHAKAARYAAAGIAAMVIDESTLLEAEPELRRGLAGAVHVPGDSVVYPPALCAFLLERAQGRGARVLRGTAVLHLVPGAVVTGSARHEADFIVNAAGIDAPHLTPGLPVVARKGHLVITERHPGFCHHQLVELGYMQSAHVMTAESVAFNMQPRRTGQLLIGSSRELAGADAAINRDITARMLRRAAAFMPRLTSLTALRTWTGMRPATSDKLPLIGAWDSTPGLWIAAGHEGLGVTTALATAHILVDMMLERTPPIDASPFSPARILTTVTA